MIKLNVRYSLYFVLFISFLLSMTMWIGWGYGRESSLIVSLLLLAHIIFGRISLDINRRSVVFFLLILFSNLFTHYTWGVGSLYQYFPYFVILCLKDEDKIQCLECITKWFGYLMVPGLILYVILLFVDLPSLGTLHATEDDWALDKGYGVAKNYIFFVKQSFHSYEIRFTGPFREPGYVGMMGAFLLFVNQFDFKKKGMWSIFIAVLCSLSLAGFVLAFLAFWMIRFYQGKTSITKLSLYLFVFVCVICIGMFYNDGDNILNEKILSRLEFDEEKGFSGNNRVGDVMMYYYANMWTDMKTLLFGYSKEFMDWLTLNGVRGTGYYRYMCRFGLLGTIAAMAPYFYYTITAKNKMFARMAFIFVVIMFWQRSYPFWTSWIICFVFGVTRNQQKWVNK